MGTGEGPGPGPATGLAADGDPSAPTSDRRQAEAKSRVAGPPPRDGNCRSGAPPQEKQRGPRRAAPRPGGPVRSLADRLRDLEMKEQTRPSLRPSSPSEPSPVTEPEPNHLTPPRPFAVTSGSARPSAAAHSSRGLPGGRAASNLFTFKAVFVWKVVSLCFAQIRTWKRQERGRERRESSRGGMKKQTLDKVEAGLAGGPEHSSPDNYLPPPRKLPSEPLFTAVRLCPAGWQLSGGCLLHVASACTPSPLSTAGGAEGGAGWEGGRGPQAPGLAGAA